MRASSNKADIDAAIEHLLWCVERQSNGFFPIRVLRTEKDGQHSVEDTRWFDNCDPELEKGLRAFLKKILQETIHGSLLAVRVLQTERQGSICIAKRGCICGC